MFYTEVFKIIEAAMQKDTDKVISYAKLLAGNLQKDGDGEHSERIFKLLKGKPGNPVYLDQLLPPPVDQESRIKMADIIDPSAYNESLILSESISEKINFFIQTYQNRHKIKDAGFDMPCTLLLYGLPGCGKTTIAKYIAHKLNIPLVTVRFDSLVSSLLGNTAKNIRKIFDFGNSNRCILFLDELDAIAKARDDQHELGELKRVINSLLQNIDGFSSNILIGATNHPELLDKAIWRRFNSIIKVDRPDKTHIKSLVTTFLKEDYLDDLSDKKWSTIIDALDGLTPSDIKNIAFNAFANNIINKADKIEYQDLLYHSFLFKNNNNYSTDQLIRFLKHHSVSIRDIAESANISIRQVENFLNQNNHEKESTN